jgi:hypothetical protein
MEKYSTKIGYRLARLHETKREAAENGDYAKCLKLQGGILQLEMVYTELLQGGGSDERLRQG